MAAAPLHCSCATATAINERAESDLANGTHIVGEGHNYGAFAQFGTASGFYGAAFVKRDDFDVHFSNGSMIPLVRTNAESTGFDGEVGWRTPSFGALLDVNAGVSYVRTDWDDFIAGNIAFDPETGTSLRGRIGARLGWSGHFALYVGAKLFHEFDGNDDIIVASGALVDRIERNGRGSWGRLEGGLGGGAGGGPLLSVWVDVGEVQGWGVSGGFRF